MYQLFMSNLYARSDFRKASLIRVLEVVLFVGLIFVFRENQHGLINSKTLANGIVFLIFLYLFGKTFSLSELKKTFIKYKEQPLYLCPAHFLNALSREIPMILLTYFYGLELGAIYALANRIIRAPIGLIGTAIGHVFRTRTMNLLGNDKKIDKIYKQTLAVLFVFAIMFLSILFVAIDPLIEAFFNEEWLKAIDIIKIISFVGALQLISNPLGNVFIVTKNQKLDLVWQIILFILISTALIVGGLKYDFEITLYLFSFSYSLGYIINIIMSYRLSK
jgi:lipopolysaccharide exporter